MSILKYLTPNLQKKKSRLRKIWEDDLLSGETKKPVAQIFRDSAPCDAGAKTVLPFLRLSSQVLKNVWIKLNI